MTLACGGNDSSSIGARTSQRRRRTARRSAETQTISSNEAAKSKRAKREAAVTVNSSHGGEISPAASLTSPSSLELLSGMATSWIEKERAWYAGNATLGQTVATPFGLGTVMDFRERDETYTMKLKYGTLSCRQETLTSLALGFSSRYEPVDNAGKARVRKDQLEKAKSEYASRFAFCTEEEDSVSHEFSGSPFLLVATNVGSSWTVPPEYEKSLRFMLVPDTDASCALFITCVPGSTHGTVAGEFADMLGTYRVIHNLTEHVRKCHSGGETYQPDIRIYPTYPDQIGPKRDNDPDSDNRPFSRLIVEFEFGNSNASKLRDVGYATLMNDFTTLFLGIKVWQKSSSGTFGAAAVVSEKDHASGAIAMRQAFDFGTKQLAQQSRDAWNDAAVNALSNSLPPVLASDWNRPLPINATTVTAGPALGQAALPIDPAWKLTLPKDLVFYRMPSSDAPGSAYIPAVLQNALPDFEFDLKMYQRHIDRILQ